MIIQKTVDNNKNRNV